MKTITQAHPPLPLAELVAEIRSFDSRTLQSQLEFLTKLVAVHPILNIRCSFDTGYYRARLLRPGSVLRCVDDAIWRKDFPAEPGRANPAGFPILYLGNRPEACFREIGAIVDDVLIAEFRIRQGKSSLIAPIGEFARIFACGSGRLMGDSAKDLYRFFAACDYHELKALVITDSFLQRCMASDEAPYRISSHIAHSMLQKQPEISGIAYESTKLPGAMNFAMRTETFWDAWGLCSASTLRVSYLAENLYAEDNRRNVIGVDENGLFSWGPVVENARVLQRLHHWHPRKAGTD